MTRSSRTRRAAAAVGAVLLAACGGELGRTQPQARALPPYSGRDAELFEDGLEPKAVGYDVAEGAGKGDKLLAERTGASDGVVRARVVTITTRQEESGQSLLLGLHPLETLAGRHAPTAEFTLVVSPRSPAGGVLGATGSRLVGLTFVVFVRGFAPEKDPGDGDGELHFHLARDDKVEQDMVRAASLGPLR